MSTTLSEILAVHGLDENDLKLKLSADHWKELTDGIENWKAVGVVIGFDRVDVDIIDEMFSDTGLERFCLYTEWIKRHKGDATCLKLAEQLFTGERMDLLKDLCGILASDTSTYPSFGVSDEPSSSKANTVMESRHEGTLIQYQSESQTREESSDVSQQLVQETDNSETSRSTSVRLREKDIANLLRLLQSHSFQWNNIGLSLGFLDSELTNIFGIPRLYAIGPTGFLQELLSQWVQWPTASHPIKPTLEALCAALRSSLVGLGSLADKVNEEMRQSTGGVYARADSLEKQLSKFAHSTPKMSTTLSEILAVHGLDENDLRLKLSADHWKELTEGIENWKAVGVVIGFDRVDVDIIDEMFSDTGLERFCLYVEWMKRHKGDATYLKLAEQLFTGERMDLLKDLCGILASDTSTNPSSGVSDKPSSSEANTVMESRHEGTLIQYQSESQTREESSDVSQQVVQETDNSGKVKVQRVVMSGQITDADRLFNDISNVIYNNYNEIGIELGLKGEVLTNELETGKFTLQQGSKKALRMLQLWRESVGEHECTYSVLAAALEKHGFLRIADKYCYWNTSSIYAVLSKFPSQLLDRQCVESHLGKLVHVIDSATMEMMASDLDLSQEEVDDIQSSWERKPVKQRLEMFKKCLEKNKSQATYRRLISALHEADKYDAIDILHSLVSATPPRPNTQHTSEEDKRLAWYGGYLKDRHVQVHVASASKKWPPLPTQQFFNLAIIKKERVHRGKIDDEFVLQSIRGQIDDILLAKSPIDLEDIFKNIEGERKVILIDGAPGSGKSTLAIHITQGWGKGELFQEFTIVILVQLRDPAVQSAKSIADLLPCPDIETARQIASAIKASNGRGILWVMDGWDELPLRLQDDSFLRDMIAPPHISPITLSSVIITSRPISSGDLSQLVSSRIEVLGFSSEEQRQYFTECLKGDTKAVDALLERLSENPAIEGSCFLPLNASIVAHLYLSDGFLPDTVHGIFSAFVRHFFSRYLCEKLGKTQQHSRIVSLDNLPPELQGAFNEMCRLAFKGTAENKVTFSHSDIEAVKDSAVICEMGLLQATPSILSEGQTVYYNFIHLSVQEFLSAVYICKLPASKQISTFNSLFKEPRFNSVFRYYAAITKLRTSRPFLSKLPRWLRPVPAGVLDLVRKMVEKRSRPLLVSLLHCLYEARDLSLCQFVAKQLGNELDLRGTSLTPVDSFALGYFLSTVSLTTSNAKEFSLDLSYCSLGDAGTKSLMCSISRHIDPHRTVNRHLHMDLSSNEIHEEGASHIADLLNSTSIVSIRTLRLAGNRIGAKLIKSIFNALDQAGVLDLVKNIIRDHSLLLSLFDYLYEARDLSLCQFVAEQLGNVLGLRDTSLTPVDCLALGYFLSTVSLTTSNTKEFIVNLNNCSLGDAGTKSLMCSISRHINPHSTVNRHLNMYLRNNEIHEEGASHIADLLNNTSTVSTLWLDGNPIGDLGLLSIFNILKANKTLKWLRVASCSMTDTGVSSLASALNTNNTLERLDIRNNDAITENGLTCLVEVLSRSSGLVKLLIPRLDKVRKTINEARQRSGLAAIEVNSHYLW